MTEKILWFQTGAVHGLPNWARRAAIGPDGTVYVPAALCGVEGDAISNAQNGGVAILFDHDHAYLPAHWVAETCPEAADLAVKIQRALRESLA